MVKEKVFKAGNVIYFEGSLQPREVYIIKSGSVVLSYFDLAKKTEVLKELGPGEIFGAKSALGGFAREETVKSITDTVLLVLTPEEFEQFLLSHPQLLMRLLRTFSHQLREIGNATRLLLGKTEIDEASAADAMFRLGMYYYNQGRLNHAKTVFERFIRDYPNSKYVSDAQQKLEEIEKGIATAAEEGPVQKFYRAESLLNEGNFDGAIEVYSQLLKEAEEGSSLYRDAMFYLGKTYFQKGELDESIKVLQEYLDKYGDSKDKNYRGALLTLAQAYEKKGEIPKARDTYMKIASTGGADDPLVQRARQKLEELK